MKSKFYLSMLSLAVLGAMLFLPTIVSAAPTANDDAILVDLDSVNNNVDVLANDTGTGTLIITNVSFTVHGSLAISGSLGTPGVTISYTPNEDYIGLDSFTYAIIDDSLMSSTGTVGITVQAVCNGVAPTITGTMGSEIITGTSGADVILGLGGDDTINGRGGKDIICGGSGIDTISGGGGVDTIFGGSGNDILSGNNGNDTIYGGSGADTIKGGGKNDNLFGGDGNDNLNGNNGDDDLFGQAGNDKLKGASGFNDLCDGGSGTDTENGNTCETTVSIP